MSHEEALGLAQILLALLVFALGIPALVLEATAEERVRHLVHRRVPQVPMMALMAVTLAIVGGLIWYSGARPDQLFWFESYSLEKTAKALTICLLIVFSLFWLFMLKVDIRSLIVWFLSVGLWMQFVFRGTFRVADVEDLIVMGESAPSGYEKNSVLSLMSRVVRRVVNAVDGYDGTILSPLFAGLVQVVTFTHRPGTAQNYVRTTEIVGESWESLRKRRFLKKPDGVALIEAASKLGEAAVKAGHETAALAFMNTIMDEKVLFRIGLAALRDQRYRIAVSALTKLEVAADESNKLTKELIGLAAYFCATGEHAASVGRSFSHRLDAQYTPEQVAEAGRRAAGEFCEIAEYAIADTIVAQLDALRPD